MAIYVTEDTRLVIQGIGSYANMVIPRVEAHGTDIVAGVSPGRRGDHIQSVPIYETVHEAVRRGHANTSLILVPAPYVKEACFEAIEAGIETIVVITEDVPIQDSTQLIAYAHANNVRLIGPNTLGVISPEKGSVSLLGSNDSRYTPGSVGVVTRSGTLSMEIAGALTADGIGQTTVFSVGGDPYVGTPPHTAFRHFDRDPETEVIVYAGEIGGTFEARAVPTLEEITTPVCATIVGHHAPEGKQMGHAGAIAADDENKLSLLAAAGARIAETPFNLPELVHECLHR